MASSQKYWRNVLPLCFVLLIDAMSFGFVLPVMGPLLFGPGDTIVSISTAIETRNFYYSAIFALPMIMLFLGAPVLGDLSDIIGRKKSMLIALLGVALSCAIAVSSIMLGSILLLLFSRGLLGFMDGSESIAQAAMADISMSSKEKVINMSLITLAASLGFALGPMLGGYAVEHPLFAVSGIEAPFVLAGTLALINAGCLAVFFEDTYIPNNTKKISFLRSFHNLTLAFKKGGLRWLSVVYLCIQFAWGLYFQATSLILFETFKYTPSQLGWFMTTLSLIFIVSLLVIIRILLRYLRLITIVLLALPLIAAGGILPFVVQTEQALWWSLLPTTIGIAISYNTLLSLLSNCVDKDNQGKVMGISVALVAVAWSLASLANPFLFSNHHFIPFAVVAAVALLAIPAVVRFLKTNSLNS